MDKQGNELKEFANKDLFPQLTDDLLILILSMLSCDLRFLCQCMLISKRFALLIPLISSGTLFIPRPQDRPPYEFLRGQVTYAFKALKSFRKIRSLHLIFIEEEDREFDLKWKAVFGSNTCSCACLVYNSITNLSSASASVSATAADSQIVYATVIGPVFKCIMSPNLWRNLLEVFYPMVESVVITDSKRQGKVCFRNSEPRDARTYTSFWDIWNTRFEEGRTSLKFFEVPELRLPKSGFLMNGVYLAISKIGENSAEDNKYDDMLNCNFGEEENVFGEALNMILGTPEDRMVVYHRNSDLRDARTCTSVLDAWNNRFEEGRTSLKFFQVPELSLPKSGFLMKGVLLAISKIGGNSAEDIKYDDMLNCGFGEEQGVFGEALNLILRTPADRRIDCSRYADGVYLSLIKII